MHPSRRVALSSSADLLRFPLLDEDWAKPTVTLLPSKIIVFTYKTPGTGIGSHCFECIHLVSTTELMVANTDTIEAIPQNTPVR
jgi:hypothetical protein